MSHQHDGKKAYASYAHAVADTHLMQICHPGHQLLAYPCEFCDAWHLGHEQRLRVQIGVNHPELHQLRAQLEETRQPIRPVYPDNPKPGPRRPRALTDEEYQARRHEWEGQWPTPEPPPRAPTPPQ